MGVRERLTFAFLVWLSVYPSVLGMNYLLEAVGLGDLPLPVTVLLTTAVTVPLIEFVVIPRVKKGVAKAEERAGIEGGLRDD
jgi:antibiotic biosynthesis monooxygenase (ABM) superfamily enzyme